MDQAERRRMRLAQLLDLAQTYKGWTRKDLAKALGRDPTKLIPGSGIPKLDFVVDLAGVLDWTVGDVVAHLWPNDAELEDHDDVSDFQVLDGQARDAHRSGEYRAMIEHARQAYTVARNAEERARACNREAGGWDGLGRYSKVLRRGAARPSRSRGYPASSRRLMLTVEPGQLRTTALWSACGSTCARRAISSISSRP